MKDYEDELIALRSENFELKMRIYIMEEQKEMAQGPENADDLKKNTTELKSELATLKKDLAYKEDLILQAAKAMELLDSKHKEAVKDLESKAANEIEHYKSMIVHLEEVIIFSK
ncbi:hypothetical protein AAG570_001568 [Ranatra chinensis]|uniref:Centrosomin N-terminal motif 1 domain-containing protein n=1 Tax=Ranatra chinensis TaxID=642074 RepID=A0ABD0Y964_9HEMI